MNEKLAVSDFKFSCFIALILFRFNNNNNHKFGVILNQGTTVVLHD